VDDLFPPLERRSLAGLDPEGAQDFDVEPFAVILERHFVDALRVERGDDRLGADVADCAILARSLAGSSRSERHTNTSGWTPSEASSRTLCWVGLVLSSPAAAMYGTSVRWMLTELPRPISLRSWRIASMNGKDSMSPTVPPISHSTKSSPSVSSCANALIASVTWGDHLDGGAEIVAAALAVDDRLVDPARGDVVRLTRGDAGEALVMAEIEIGLRPVVGDIDLAMLVAATSSRIDVEIGIELADAARDSRAPAGVPPRLAP
jgi:hypothetical protein